MENAVMKKYKKIYIEITNTCNLKCDFCPPTRRKLEFMSMDVFSKILEQIKGHTDYIYLHVKGEPLLHPELDKILDLSYEKGFKVNITTNGTLVNRVKNILLSKPAIRQINFSLHSFDGNEMDGSKEDYIGDIISFVKEAVVKTEVIIAFRLWNLDENNLVNMERERNRGLLAAIERAFDLSYKIEEKIIPERGIKIAERIYLNQDSKFQWPDMMEKEDSKSGFCYGLRNQAAILVDGTITPCCLDGEGVINLGNINTARFSEIINSKRAVNIVNGFSKRTAVEELCIKCKYKTRLG